MHKLFAPLAAAATLLAANPAYAETVPVNGMNIYYEITGEGDPLLVLPGAYMAIPGMGEIVPMLAKTHKVIAMEVQGHGRTKDIDRPITWENLADDAAGVLDALDIERPTFRLFHGRRRRHPARHPPSRKGRPDCQRLGRLRHLRHAAGLHRHDPADEARDVHRHPDGRRWRSSPSIQTVSPPSSTR